MTFAAALLFFRNETGFGGNNGFTGFKTILGMDIISAPHACHLMFLNGFGVDAVLRGSASSHE